MTTTPPTAAQLATFMSNVDQLRTLFDEVVVVFVGNNNTPLVRCFWKRSDPAAAVTIEVASDGVDDMNNAMAAAFTQYSTAGTLRTQLAAAQAQVAALQQQVDALGS